MNVLKRFKLSNDGQGLVEYGLILALVSVVAVGALGEVGNRVTNAFSTVSGVDVAAKIADGYIPIATADDLDRLGGTDNHLFAQGTSWEGVYEAGLDKKYILVSDIDLSHVDNFNPIGDYMDPFVGDFDGGGYKISSLRIRRPGENYIGLFGKVIDSTIENVGLTDVDIVANTSVGGLVGYADRSTIDCSYMTGSVRGAGIYKDGEISLGNVGGLVGANNNNSIIRDSYAISDVVGSGGMVGGLVGRNEASTILNSYSSSTVTGPGIYVGGLAGRNSSKASIKRSGWVDEKHKQGIGYNNMGPVDDATIGYTSAEFNEIILGLVH